MFSIRDRNESASANPYDDFGGWLQYIDGEGGPPQVNLGHIGGAMELFGPGVTAQYGLPDLRNSSYEDWARAGAASGLGYQNEKADGGEWLYLTKDGQRTGDKAFQMDTPYNYLKEFVLPAAALLGGGYLLGGGLGGAAASGSAGAGGAAGSSVGTLSSLTPTAVSSFTAAPISAALPAVSELGFGALGAGLGGATLGASMVPTSVTPFTAAPISAALPSVPSLGLEALGTTLGTSTLGSSLTPTSVAPHVADPISSSLPSVPSLAGGALSSLTNLVGGNAGQLLGGLLGAATSKGGTQTQERAPWADAQPALRGLLGDVDAARQQLKANPFTPEQLAAYSAGNDLTNQARGLMGGANAWAQGGMNGGFNWNRKG